MFRHFVSTRWTAALVLPLVCLIQLAWPGKARADKPSKTLHIGISASVFHDISEDRRKSAIESMKKLMKQNTGFDGEFHVIEDFNKIADQLQDKKLALGIFQGYEYSWMAVNHTGLRPLVIAVNQDRNLLAHVIVPKASTASKLADLKDKAFGLAKGSRAHCRLFLRRRAKALGNKPEAFFSKLTEPATVEDALDDVVDGTIEGTVVDSAGYASYKRRKPGRVARLKEIQTSETFPSPVAIYQEGALDADTLKRLRTGLLKADDSAEGRQTLTTWKLTGFEAIPKDYQQLVESIRKVYPPPKSDN